MKDGLQLLISYLWEISKYPQRALLVDRQSVHIIIRL